MPWCSKAQAASLESTNEGATLESSEFHAALASTVWFEWTAPADGWWSFQETRAGLEVHVYEGERVDELRLVTSPSGQGAKGFRAEAGTIYRVVVASNTADDSGASFTLIWNPAPHDSAIDSRNDLFEDATDIDAAEGKC